MAQSSGSSSRQHLHGDASFELLQGAEMDATKMRFGLADFANPFLLQYHSLLLYAFMTTM
jgi:hypothetical protein